MKDEQKFSYNGGGDAYLLKNGQTFHPYSMVQCVSIHQHRNLDKVLNLIQ